MVPHIAARKTQQRLEGFSFATPKRLLQQNRHICDIIRGFGDVRYARPSRPGNASEPVCSKMIDRDVGAMITSSHQLQFPIAAPGHCSQAKFV